ncbi:MAG: ABC transporter ATP-binding protein [Hyphomicrobiaceae bacterium]|nr:ABC transporter ATP-binding protein [Hyphomicrobiaceae bacterium]
MSGAERQTKTRIEVKDLVVRYAGDVLAVNGVSFNVGHGEHVTLLGPSGCGKTTTLRAIAGLESPSGGSIAIEGRPMYSAAERINIPAESRGVSMVFQSYAVWPHMTVFDNVAYGLRVRKQSAGEIRESVDRALGLVQMRHLADRPASKLSGGQQQRVALARAIAFSPTVVLFDEPLSNLDAKLRAEMRVELRELQSRLGITSVYVTHDQEEALAISDRVIVMNVGVIEQIGTPEEIYNRPRNRFVADFVGSANLIKGRVRGAVQNGRITFDADGGHVLQAIAPAALSGRETEVAVRTAYIDVGEGGLQDNSMPGTVRRRMFHGDFVQYVVDCSTGPIIVRRPPTNLIEEGAPVTLSFSTEACVLLEA